MQLAHVDKNSIRGIYNHAQYLENRREMMEWYADYFDTLEGTVHIPQHKTSAHKGLRFSVLLYFYYLAHTVPYGIATE